MTPNFDQAFLGHLLNMQDDSKSDSSVALAQVAVKLPTFWMAQPKIWFAQAEAQFALKKITVDETKYYYLVGSLDQDAALRVADLIYDPPLVEKYSSLKARLLATFTLSRYQMSQKLLGMAPLGDRRPSQLMNEMLALLGGHEPCSLFFTIFMDLLPTTIRPHLVPLMETTSARDLALAADGLMSSGITTISVVRKKPNKPGTASSKNEISTPKEWCRLHRKFGTKAFHCEPPCTFEQSRGAHVHSVQGNGETDHL